MQDLVLTDDDRVAPDRDGDRVAHCGVAGQSLPAGRKRVSERSLVGIDCADDVPLHAVASLENERSAGPFVAESGSEALALECGDLTRVGDERDDLAMYRLVHASWASPMVVALGTLRLPWLEARLWPVIVATSSLSIARSAVSSRSVVSAVSNPRRRAATANS